MFTDLTVSLQEVLDTPPFPIVFVENKFCSNICIQIDG